VRDSQTEQVARWFESDPGRVEAGDEIAHEAEPGAEGSAGKPPRLIENHVKLPDADVKRQVNFHVCFQSYRFCRAKRLRGQNWNPR
jgi:hypothetical protein